MKSVRNKIKLFDPIIDSSEREAILKSFDSKIWASGSGSGNVQKFENKFRNYVQSRSCIAVNSGTAALNLALSLFNIKNKEVILPSMSFVSTAHCIVANGGKPIFVDIEPDTLCINPEKIKHAISKNTAAIIPVHFGGMPCNLDEIDKIGKSFNLEIIEDAAHAVGSTWNNSEKIGIHGSAVCFSFHPVKNLAMPTGGLISLNHKNHKKFQKILNSRRWCGITDRKNVKYDVKEIGWNYYMNEFSAAIGIEQLKKLNKTNSRRKEIAKIYSKELKIEEKMPFDKNCSFHFYWIQVKNRKNFMKKMSENNIETGIHYNPIHKMSFYNSKIPLPVTEIAGSKIVSLPTHPNLSNNDINRIIKMANKFAK